MNLADMRELVAEGMANIVDVDDPEEIDKRLNRAYQYTLPELVDGEFSESIWEFQTPYPWPDLAGGRPGSGLGVVEFPEWVIATKISKDAPLLVDSYGIYYFTRPQEFWAYYFPDRDPAEARPYAVLDYQRRLEFRPIPDASTYKIQCPVRSRPHSWNSETERDELVALADAGLADDAHAEAVAYVAVWKWANTLGEDEISIRYGGPPIGPGPGPGSMAGQAVGQIRGRSHFKPHTRKLRRSF